MNATLSLFNVRRLGTYGWPLYTVAIDHPAKAGFHLESVHPGSFWLCQTYP